MKFKWIVTDADGKILGLPDDFSGVDFDGAGPGTCLVLHISYVDGLQGLGIRSLRVSGRDLGPLRGQILLEMPQLDCAFVFDYHEGLLEFIEQARKSETIELLRDDYGVPMRNSIH